VRALRPGLANAFFKTGFHLRQFVFTIHEWGQSCGINVCKAEKADICRHAPEAITAEQVRPPLLADNPKTAAHYSG
jgi:hypothetical protein